MLSRRALLARAGLSTAAVLATGFAAAACSSSTRPSQSERSPAAQSSDVTPTTPNGLLGFAFNTGSRDVTVFDVATRQPLATRPLDATVQWLSNEQRFWDGRSIWTYDVWDGIVQAIAIDPRQISIARSISTGGRGPAHSLMLTAEGSTAWLNIAGDDHLAVIDVEEGTVIDRVRTGAFP